MTIALCAALLIATAPPAKPRSRPSAQAAPEACQKPVDETVGTIGQGLAILQDEAQRREDANLDRGQAAFERYLEEKAPAIRAARAEAERVEATLSDDDKGRCETYAFAAFHKMWVRYGSVISVYHDRIRVFRLLGEVMR